MHWIGVEKLVINKIFIDIIFYSDIYQNKTKQLAKLKYFILFLKVVCVYFKRFNDNLFFSLFDNARVLSHLENSYTIKVICLFIFTFRF